MSSKKQKRLLGTSKISFRFQVTIPREARKAFNLKEGDVIIFLDDNGELVLRNRID